VARENIDLLLHGVARLNAGDLDGAMAPFHLDVTYRDVDSGYGTETTPKSRGRDALRRYIAEWLEYWDGYREDVEETLDLGDVVVLLVRTQGRGRRSGIPMDERHAEVHQFENGLVVRITVYASYPDALAAAGLVDETSGG